MKTQNEILTYIYQKVKASDISTLISGGVYKRYRPKESALEDCIISLFGGITGKFLQDGGISIKIYFKDVKNGGTYFENDLRGQVLEDTLQDFSNTLIKDNVYSFQIETRQTYTEKVLDNDTHEHYAILKINFRTLTQ